MPQHGAVLAVGEGSSDADKGDAMIFSKQLRSREHTRQFVVDKADERGWQVREEQDNLVVKQAWLRDWHRVEKAMMRFAVEAAQLQRAGWQEVRGSA